LFVLFAAPPENELRWQETGIEGAVRFLRRVYGMVFKWRDAVASSVEPETEAISASARA